MVEEPVESITIFDTLKMMNDMMNEEEKVIEPVVEEPVVEEPVESITIFDTLKMMNDMLNEEKKVKEEVGMMSIEEEKVTLEEEKVGEETAREYRRFSSMTVVQLRKKCKEKGFKGYSKLTKNNLIELLLSDN